MKTNRLIILFIFSIAPLFSFAQTFEEKGYHPMIKEGKRWEGYCYYGQENQTDYTAIINGDTIINGVSYKKVYERSTELYGNEKFHYAGAMLEDIENKKVYKYNDQNGGLILCALFTDKAAGDTIMISDKFGYHLYGNDLVYSNGNLLYLSQFQPREFDQDIAYTTVFNILEGCGSYYYSHPFNWIGNNSIVTIYKVYEDDECVIDFGNAYYYHTDIKQTNIFSDKHNCYPRQGIFDLQGRRLAERPERGIFIENGRKIAK